MKALINLHRNPKTTRFIEFFIQRLTRKYSFLAYFAFFLFTLSTSSAQNLFNTEMSYFEKMNSEENERIERYKQNKFNENVTKINMSRVPDIQRDGRFSLSIPDDDNTYVAISNYVDSKDDINYEWTGIIVDHRDEEVGSIVLIEQEGVLFGEFSVGSRVFIIEDMGESNFSSNGRVTYLIEKNAEELNKLSCGLNQDESKTHNEDEIIEEMSQNLNRSTQCNTEIRVLVLYTTGANNEWNASQAAYSMMLQANSVLSTSGAGYTVKFKLAGLKLYSGYDETSKDLIDIRDHISSNTMIQNWRFNTYDADLVVLLTDQTAGSSNSFGVGYLHNLNWSHQAHAVVKVNGYNRYTFLHEMLHNMGCKHDNDGSTNKGLKYWARGKALPNNKKTVMAVTGLSGTRVNKISNPDVYYQGTSTGNVNSRDNVRQIEDVALKVSNYDTDNGFFININGPNTITGDPVNRTWCADACRITLTSYSWYWSPDGYTYYWFSGGNSCGSKMGNTFGSNSTIYIKLITTASSGTTYTRVMAVTNQSNNYYRPVTAITKLVHQNEGVFREKIDLTTKTSGEKLILSQNDGILVGDLFVYNVNGQCVKMININDSQENGSHEVSIDITDLIDGVYFIRMSSSTETHTVKFVKQ